MPLRSLQRGWQSPELTCVIENDVDVGFEMAVAKMTPRGSCSLRRGWSTPEPVSEGGWAAQERNGDAVMAKLTPKPLIIRPLALKRKRVADAATGNSACKALSRKCRLAVVETFFQKRCFPPGAASVPPLNTLLSESCAQTPNFVAFSAYAEMALVKQTKKQRICTVSKFYNTHCCELPQAIQTSPLETATCSKRAPPLLPSANWGFGKPGPTSMQTPLPKSRQARRGAYQKWLQAKRAPAPQNAMPRMA
jgi:hypothetical protein